MTDPAGPLGAVLPSAVRYVEATGDLDGTLFPAEEALVATAGPLRAGEFRAARICAHRALELAGRDPLPVLRGPRGEPTWPPGLVGSLTHCPGYRAAAVAGTEDLAALGIDAEPAAPLPAGVVAQVASPQERAALDRLGGDTPWDRILFSAKESVYKAWYPVMTRWLGFEDADVRLAPDGTFRVDLQDGPLLLPDGRVLAELTGRWAQAQGFVATAVTVPSS